MNHRFVLPKYSYLIQLVFILGVALSWQPVRAATAKALVVQAIPGTNIQQVFDLAAQLGIDSNDKSLGWIDKWMQDADRWRIIYVDLDAMKAHHQPQMSGVGGAIDHRAPQSLVNSLNWSPVERVKIQLFDDVAVILHIRNIQSYTFRDETRSIADYKTWYAEATVEGGWGTAMVEADPNLANVENIVHVSGTDAGWIRIDHLVFDGLVYRISPITDYSQEGKRVPLFVGEYDPRKPRENLIANDLAGDVSIEQEQPLSPQQEYDRYESLFLSVPFWMNLDEKTKQSLLYRERKRLHLDEGKGASKNLGVEKSWGRSKVPE